MPIDFRNHISIIGRTEALSYTSNQTGRSNIIPRSGLDRRSHGRHVQNEFNSAVETFDRQDFVYLVFKSAWDFLLDIDKFNDIRGDFRLAFYKEVVSVEDAVEHKRIEATIYLNSRPLKTHFRS